MFWDIWPMPPIVESKRDVLYVDGIYLGRKACVLICCDDKHVLGWYLCRYEHSRAWKALLSRIAEPRIVVSDGGTGLPKALRQIWPCLLYTSLPHFSLFLVWPSSQSILPFPLQELHIQDYHYNPLNKSLRRKL